MRKIFALIIAAAALTSCRSIIFEDRSACPKFVFFQVSNPEHFNPYDDVFSTVFRHPEGGHVAADKPKLREIQDLSYYVEVRKTDAVKGYGLIGWEGLIQNGNDWLVPLGMQADTLFRYSYTSDIGEESTIIPVEFVKEHAKVTVRFVGVESFKNAAGRFPFDVIIRSNTCGINGFTGLPVRGDYEYKPVETTTGRFEFTLLRQANSHLTMELYGRPHVYETEGHVATFDLYSIIAEQGGVTWKEKNLPDIDIEIDYKESDISINVLNWEETDLHFDF